ncbi:S-adenosyl-L-methionine-dependent methyltransferases superfamily protein [Euphorbia peplus]|nr:S-adenosyl-L-methionine-dependent methyltransferases superfamily protein [Euphorbia peplus]
MLLQLLHPSLQIPSLSPLFPIKSSTHFSPKNLNLPIKTSLKPPRIAPESAPALDTQSNNGIPIEDVQILAKFKSRYNYIRVLQISRQTDHPLAGSRLLLLDTPGNIHSISFHFKLLTQSYYDVFATLPPILPPGPVGILGFGAGTAARLILEFYPDVPVHGWEIDPSVISVGRKFFGLEKLEKQHKDRLFLYIGDALGSASDFKGGFSGVIVDLFSKGSVIPELQDPNTWEALKGSLRKGGRIMVNIGGGCVEAEDKRRDGDVVMADTLKAMRKVFDRDVFVLSIGDRNDDSAVALTGELPDSDAWKSVLPKSLRFYVDMWAQVVC